MSGSKDLFDDSTMTFGEHLEVLRVHLWKAIIGLIISVVVTLFYGQHLIAVIRAPIDKALYEHGQIDNTTDDVSQLESGWNVLKKLFTEEDEPIPQVDKSSTNLTITVHVKPEEIAAALHSFDPERYPEVEIDDSTDDAAPKENDKDTKSESDKAEDDSVEEDSQTKGKMAISLTSEHFRGWQKTAEDVKKPVTLNVQG